MSHIDIELSSPIEVDGATVTSVRLREPTVGDQLASDEVKGSDATKELTMFANLCEIAPADIKRLTLRDYRKLQKEFLNFLG